MIKFKSFLKVLMIIAVSIQFTYAVQNGAVPSGYLSCVESMGRIFGLDSTPLQCVLYGIKNLKVIGRFADRINSDVRSYYLSLSTFVLPKRGLKIPGLFCSEEFGEEYLEDCEAHLLSFGHTFEDNIYNALYDHKQESSTAAIVRQRQIREERNKVIHVPDTFGYGYLHHVAYNVQINPNAEIVSPRKYCHIIYGIPLTLNRQID